MRFYVLRSFSPAIKMRLSMRFYSHQQGQQGEPGCRHLLQPGGEQISSEEVTTLLCEKKIQKVKTSELTSTAPLLARQPSTGALLPNISAMFISTFLFLSVFYFYWYYFFLISQQCSSWSPESSAKSQQCSSLPELTKGQSSSSNCTLSLRATLYYEGTTTTHSAPRSPICLLAIFTSREKPSRYHKMVLHPIYCVAWCIT